MVGRLWKPYLFEAMTPYFINLAVVIGLVFSAYHSKRWQGRLILLVLAATAMIILGGFRDETVGTDTENYVTLFSNNYELSQLGELPYEYGFSVFVWAIRRLSESYAWYLLLSAALVVGCFSVAIFRNCKNYPVAYFVLLTAGFYTYSFNTARQGIALAIFSLAIRSMFKEKVFNYFLLIAIAALFHVSALAALPIYWVSKVRKVRTRNLLLVATLIVLLLCGGFFLRGAFSLSDKYEVYAEASAGGGYVSFAFNASLAVAFLILKKYMNRFSFEYGVYLNIYLLGLAVSFSLLLLNQHPSGVLRLGSYFFFVQIFIVPLIFLNMPRTASGAFVKSGFVLLYLTYFYFSLSAFGGLVPYEFNNALRII